MIHSYSEWSLNYFGHTSTDSTIGPKHNGLSRRRAQTLLRGVVAPCLQTCHSNIDATTLRSVSSRIIDQPLALRWKLTQLVTFICTIVLQFLSTIKLNLLHRDHFSQRSSEYYRQKMRTPSPPPEFGTPMFSGRNLANQFDENRMEREYSSHRQSSTHRFEFKFLFYAFLHFYQ